MEVVSEAPFLCVTHQCWLLWRPKKEAAYANEVGQDAEALARGNTHVVKEF